MTGAPKLQDRACRDTWTVRDELVHCRTGNNGMDNDGQIRVKQCQSAANSHLVLKAT